MKYWFTRRFQQVTVWFSLDNFTLVVNRQSPLWHPMLSAANAAHPQEAAGNRCGLNYAWGRSQTPPTASSPFGLAGSLLCHLLMLKDALIPDTQLHQTPCVLHVARASGWETHMSADMNISTYLTAAQKKTEPRKIMDEGRMFDAHQGMLCTDKTAELNKSVISRKSVKKMDSVIKALLCGGKFDCKEVKTPCRWWVHYAMFGKRGRYNIPLKKTDFSKTSLCHQTAARRIEETGKSIKTFGEKSC